jgi:hypothetical protein
VEFQLSAFFVIDVQKLASLEKDRLTEIKGNGTASKRIIWTAKGLVVTSLLDD